MAMAKPQLPNAIQSNDKLIIEGLVELVEHSTHNPEIEGSYPFASNVREKMGKNFVCILHFWHFLSPGSGIQTLDLCIVSRE
jgi:hypothetical protein